MINLFSGLASDAYTVYRFCAVRAGMKSAESVEKSMGDVAIDTTRLAAAAGVAATGFYGASIVVAIAPTAATLSAAGTYSYNVAQEATKAQEKENVSAKKVLVNAAQKTAVQGVNLVRRALSCGFLLASRALA